MDERDDPRPLIAGTVRWSDEAIEVLVGLDRVLIEGDLELTRRVLGDCDGATPLAELVRRHGAAAAEVVEELRAAGAIVDGEQAWRVLHRQSAVGTILGRPIDADEVLALGRATFRPAGHRRRQRRRGAGTDRRRHTRADGRATLRRCGRAAGSNDVRGAGHRARRDVPRRPATASVPSAGGLYPLVVHVLLREPLAPLQRGLWWLDPVASTLHRVSEPVPAASLS